MNVVRMRMNSDLMQIIKKMAIAAQIGGRSEVRKVEDRIENLKEDQLAGQIGECGLHLLVYDDITQYVCRRERMNADKHKGDGGSDLDELPWDIKTSVMRDCNDPMTYRLLVRPRERHKDFIYILGLVEDINIDEPTLIMPGWCHEREIPGHTHFGGKFDGAHVLHANALHPMEEIQNFIYQFRMESMISGYNVPPEISS